MGMSIDELEKECRYCYREVDASGLEGFRCTNKFVNETTRWCRPKNANESCSSCKFCKPREEIRMSIDEAMNHIKYGIIEGNYPLPRDLGVEACNIAIDTMRKYQKIQEVMDSRPDDDAKSNSKALSEIEVIMYGDND